MRNVKITLVLLNDVNFYLSVLGVPLILENLENLESVSSHGKYIENEKKKREIRCPRKTKFALGKYFSSPDFTVSNY